MSRPLGTNYWKPIPAALLWEWYWEKLLTTNEIGKRWTKHRTDIEPPTGQKFPTGRWVSRQLEENGIPQRSGPERSRLWQLNKEASRYKGGVVDRAHRIIYENFHGPLAEDELVHHRDHVRDNNHPLNLQALTRYEHTRYHTNAQVGWNTKSRPPRIPLFEVYMRMAENIALRSHHHKTRVGCVITSFDLRRVLAVGFNGNAAGLSNLGDSPREGKSGMIHAEENALISASEHGTPRIMFVTTSPCLQCTKLLINAGIKYLYYRRPYRDLHPMKIAKYYGIMVCQYSQWEKTRW